MSGPACAGQGPTAPASTYGVAQFAVVIVAVIYMILTSIITLYMRRFRRRLRVRSLLPIVLGSTGGIAFVLIRAVYDLIGIEHFPCTLLVAMYYIFPIVVVSTDLVSIVSFLAKQYKRQTLNANTLQALQKLHQDQGEDGAPRTTVRVYFEGLWNYLLGLSEVTSFSGRFNEKFWFRTPPIKVSLTSELSYEFIAALLFSSPYIIAMIIRIYTVPAYDPANGCTGCLLGWEDLVIATAVTLFCGIPIASLIIRARVKNIPDPLAYLFDVQISFVIILSLILTSSILFIVDPQGLMRSQQVDWYVFEMIAIVYIHSMRTVVQLARTRRMHKLGEANVKLLDILSDPRGAILFEKHLIAGTFQGLIHLSPSQNAIVLSRALC